MEAPLDTIARIALRLIISFRFNIDGAIRLIANDSADPEFRGFIPCRIAKKHPLHTSIDRYFQPLHLNRIALRILYGKQSRFQVGNRQR